MKLQKLPIKGPGGGEAGARVGSEGAASSLACRRGARERTI